VDRSASAPARQGSDLNRSRSRRGEAQQRPCPAPAPSGARAWRPAQSIRMPTSAGPRGGHAIYGRSPANEHGAPRQPTRRDARGNPVDCHESMGVTDLPVPAAAQAPEDASGSRHRRSCAMAARAGASRPGSRRPCEPPHPMIRSHRTHGRAARAPPARPPRARNPPPLACALQRHAPLP